MSEQIKKPVFIIGAGRSGSSIFYSVFSRHPQVIWMSRLLNKFSYNDDLSFYRRVMSFSDNALAGETFRKRLPARECYPFWHTVFSGYNAPWRDLTESDVTNRVKKRMITALEKISYNNKERHVLKLTGWSRIRFLKAIFPDAKFIHMVRDGRAVCNSLLNVEFWRGYQGPYQWRWGPLSESDQEILDKYEGSFVALSGIQWNIILEAIAQAQTILQEDEFVEIRYEDFCERPMEVMEKVVEFSELEWSEGVRTKLSRVKVSSNNYKWKQDLTGAQINCLNDIMRDNLARFNYSIDV